MRSLEQRRAGNAMARVTQLAGRLAGFKSRYRAYTDRLGPTVVMNGLGQALATERAAAGPRPGGDDAEAHQCLYDNVQQWLCREDGVYPEGADLLQAITDHDQSHYLRAQTEALAWLEWHKKFCRASFPAGHED